MTMSFVRNLVVVSLFITIVASCKKDSKDNSAITLVNRIDRNITYDVYTSYDDYVNNRNVYERITLQPNEKLVLENSKVTSGNTYYVDWYSDDFYYNNWFNDETVFDMKRVQISPKPGDNTYYTEQAYNGPNRIAFLNGGSTQSNWIAIGAYLYSKSTGYSNQWDNVSVNSRFRQITVRKDFSATYEYKDEGGNVLTENLNFIVHQSDVPYIQFQDALGANAGNMTGGALPSGTPPDYESSATDTVLTLFPNSEYLYLMIRQ